MIGRSCTRCGGPLLGEGALPPARICEPCIGELLASPDGSLSGFLGALDCPAFLVGRDDRIEIANPAFCAIHRGRAGEPVGLPIGTALGCRFAPSTEHCGEMAGCIHCHLVRVIRLSRLSDVGLREAPVSLPDGAGAIRRHLLTTRRAGSAILVVLRTA